METWCSGDNLVLLVFAEQKPRYYSGSELKNLEARKPKEVAFWLANLELLGASRLEDETGWS